VIFQVLSLPRAPNSFPLLLGIFFLFFQKKNRKSWLFKLHLASIFYGNTAMSCLFAGNQNFNNRSQFAQRIFMTVYLFKQEENVLTKYSRY